MIAYVARRLLWAVVLLAVISFLTFVIFTVLPSADPAVLRAGKQPSPALVEAIRQNLGLDDPWYVQYWRYMRDLVLHFDLGYSYQTEAPVLDQLVERMPATASLVLGAAVIWLLVGVGLGVLSAVRRHTWLDRLSMGAALVAVSIPVYWLGLIALYLFADDIGRLPLLKGAGSYVPLTEDPITWAQALLLPWLVLAATSAAFSARLMRGELIDVMGEDYVRTARAKGLRERRVIWRHGVRSAITPVITVLGLDVGILLGGAILTETVFDIPGVGQLAYTSIRKADLPMIEGTVLLGAFFIVFANLVVDVLYAALDPRVRR